MYTALKETESRATDLVPLWKVPLLCHVIPRQRRAAAAVALIRRTTEDLVARCKDMVEAGELLPPPPAHPTSDQNTWWKQVHSSPLHPPTPPQNTSPWGSMTFARRKALVMLPLAVHPPSKHGRGGWSAHRNPCDTGAGASRMPHVCALSAQLFTHPGAAPIFGRPLTQLKHCQESSPCGGVRGVVRGSAAEERDRGREGFQEGYINEADPSVLRFLIASRSAPAQAAPTPTIGAQPSASCFTMQDGLPESEGP